MNTKPLWDVIVVGGGPAGMMAAGRAAERGLSVLLLEKNESLGKKLLITGGGRCNVTNSEFDIRKFLGKFKENGKFLFSAFSQYGVRDALDFFHAHGMDTKVENELRTFPVSNKAQSVWDVLVSSMHEHGVSVQTRSEVIGIHTEEGLATGVIMKNKTILYGRSIIIATGGTSRPETGSTGDGYTWLKKIGHTIIEPTPSLVPIAVKDTWIRRLAGVSISDVKITLLQNNEKQGIVKGKILFTHIGLSGPTILNMSKDVGELLKYGDVILSLDLLPHEDFSTLNNKLQEIFSTFNKKKLKNILPDIIPSAIAPVVAELSGIDPEKNGNSITREERLRLMHLLKGIPIHVASLLGTDKAIISSGGVILDEVDFKTMRSRLFSNLYLIGDILNIDRPSGGYSLQLCWTTGYIAGNSVDVT